MQASWSCQSLQIFLIIFLITFINCENKYSRNANEKKERQVDFRKLEKPFRMNKLNMLWTKAQQRLTEPKLKSLYSDLMIHDKEEIILKRMKSEGGDKEGMREADLRRKLTNIMSNYGLREHFDDNVKGKKEYDAFNSVLDDSINKSLFKDKKLNHLWMKAEYAGFTSEELSALKEEFTHHQEKIDQYYEILNKADDEVRKERDEFENAVDQEQMEKFNEVADTDTNEIGKDKAFIDKANLVREKHRGLRDNLDRLQRVVARGPNNREFIEPKVQGLWKIAVSGNFTVDELESLKVELLHYENRLLKLRNLHADHVRNIDKHHTKVAATGDKMDHFEDQQQMIKKHTRKVEKMHADLEGRILQRHTEL